MFSQRYYCKELVLAEVECVRSFLLGWGLCSASTDFPCPSLAVSIPADHAVFGDRTAPRGSAAVNSPMLLPSRTFNSNALNSFSD